MSTPASAAELPNASSTAKATIAPFRKFTWATPAPAKKRSAPAATASGANKRFRIF